MKTRQQIIKKMNLRIKCLSINIYQLQQSADRDNIVNSYYIKKFSRRINAISVGIDNLLNNNI